MAAAWRRDELKQAAGVREAREATRQVSVRWRTRTRHRGAWQQRIAELTTENAALRQQVAELMPGSNYAFNSCWPPSSARAYFTQISERHWLALRPATAHTARDHGQAQPLAHAHAQRKQTQVGIGFTEILAMKRNVP